MQTDRSTAPLRSAIERTSLESGRGRHRLGLPDGHDSCVSADSTSTPYANASARMPGGESHQHHRWQVEDAGVAFAVAQRSAALQRSPVMESFAAAADTHKIARLRKFLNVYGIVSIILFGGLFS